jgi:hypothetical protein
VSLEMMVLLILEDWDIAFLMNTGNFLQSFTSHPQG